MNTEQLITELSCQCDALRSIVLTAVQEVTALHKRLEQIVQQLHKNIEVRDQNFPTDFNDFCTRIRKELDAWEPGWAQLRAATREIRPTNWTADLALPAKGFNSHARALSRASDELITAYDAFNRTYKSFTAAKLNVFLLTACQTDIENWTSKILFLAREIMKYTEKTRGIYARG